MRTVTALIGSAASSGKRIRKETIVSIDFLLKFVELEVKYAWLVLMGRASVINTESWKPFIPALYDEGVNKPRILDQA